MKRSSALMLCSWMTACGDEAKDVVSLDTGTPATTGTTETGTTDTEEPDIPDGTLEEVLPIVQEHCLGCHSASAAAAELDLETDFCAAVLDGRLIIPGSTGESLLYRRLTSDDAPMPPTGRLDDDLTRPIGVWILNGAPCE
jgi:hypothetical protein